jgi:hypothetical protein
LEFRKNPLRNESSVSFAHAILGGFQSNGQHSNDPNNCEGDDAKCYDDLNKRKAGFFTKS